MTNVWCFRAVFTGPSLMLETGLEAILGAVVLSVKETGSAETELRAWFEHKPEPDLLDEVVARSINRNQLVDRELIYYPNRDWLAENAKALPALRVGPFWIYGRHVKDRPPAGCLALQVEAALAFGSGTHPTTQLCLLVLADQRRVRRRLRRILDMGCGSAILAMAAQRLYPASDVFAVDHDPVCIRTATENRRKNQISPMKLRIAVSEGFAQRSVSRHGPYDLIMANILAGPLRRMAGDLSTNLQAHGRLILSGLLGNQARQCIATYQARHMILERRLDKGEWTCLVFRKQRIG